MVYWSRAREENTNYILIIFNYILIIIKLF
nr:MAG TPA: hypothetical protein [Ackermannviridae sp.]